MRRNPSLFSRIPYPIQLFLLGITPSLPWIIFHFYEKNYGLLSNSLTALLWGIYLVWLVFHLRILWGACHNPFFSLANLVHSLHQGDYTQRTRNYQKKDAVGHLYEEINTLAKDLQDNRFAAIESIRKFQYLIDQLEIGVVAFNEQKQLTMINLYLTRVLRHSPSVLLGSSIESLSLEALWDCESGRTLWLDFPQKSSRYLIHVTQFREEGRPQKLFLLSDVQDPLREEERTAWKRLIRVMGHELNNSLTPIISLSQSLKSRFQKLDMPEERRQSTMEALEMIALRAQGLNRFIDDYSKLAKLPDPDRKPLDLAHCLGRMVHLMNNPAIQLAPGPDCQVLVDSDQNEQMIVNILRNAQEAIPEENGKIIIHWVCKSTDVVIYIDDNGPGIENGENLFVPFFSTKPGGSGIGLVLSRQIAEANGGSIQLENREEQGCRVTIRLPLFLS